MLQKANQILEKIETYPLTPVNFLLAFSAIIVFRMLGENLILGLAGRSSEFFVGSALVAFLFFLFSFLLILIFIAHYLKKPVKKVANVLLWGYLLVVFPPIIDKLWCGKIFCWSFYAFDSLSGLLKRFVTFFGDGPTIGITYGVRVEVALAVIFLAIYVFLKTRKVLKSLLGGLIAYIILFILGSFPSWLTFALLTPAKRISAIEGFDIAGVFLSPAKYFSLESADTLNALNVKMNLIYAFLIFWVLILFFWKYFREKFWTVAKNVRWTQTIIHAGLVITGAGLGAFFFPNNFTLRFGNSPADNLFSFLALSNLVLAAVSAWLSSVFLNDWADLPIDRITNKNRPLADEKVSVSEYKQLFAIFFPLSLILALTVGVKFFLIALSYQAIAWAYSAWPFRLKRFPGVASFISALALILLFISGFILLADNQNIALFPASFFWLTLVAFTISLPVKDLKDIEGDRKNEVWTVPVLLGEAWARFAIGLGIFISYALSVVWLNAKILFFPAMILGALSFWILQNKKISPRRVHVWIFGLLFVYVLLMAYLVFWPAMKFQL